MVTLLPLNQLFDLTCHSVLDSYSLVDACSVLMRELWVQTGVLGGCGVACECNTKFEKSAVIILRIRIHQSLCREIQIGES